MKVKEKKVELIELFYDLIYVYALPSSFWRIRRQAICLPQGL